MIGALRTRVRLYAPQEVEDAGGGRTLTSIEIGWVWAQINITRSAEDGAAGRTRTTQFVEAIIRARSDVTRDVTLTHAGIRYRVFAVAPYDPQGRYQRLLAEEDTL